MLKIENYMGEFIGANMYVIDDGVYSYIIDPCVSYKFIEKRLVHPLKWVLVTHAHVDHIYHLKDYLPLNIMIGAHKNAFSYMSSPEKNLSADFGSPLSIMVPDNQKMVLYDSKKINLGDTEITVIATPGHSDDSLTFKINHNLFTGDCLFAGSIGRTDFWNSNSSDMLKSLEKLSGLKGDYTVYPGHDEATTLSYECDNNPFLTRID